MMAESDRKKCWNCCDVIETHGMRDGREGKRGGRASAQWKHVPCEFSLVGKTLRRMGASETVRRNGEGRG